MNRFTSIRIPAIPYNILLTCILGYNTTPEKEAKSYEKYFSKWTYR